MSFKGEIFRIGLWKEVFNLADYEICSEMIRLLRLQRHDFINHIQVIHAMIQLGRTEKALKYIEDLAKDPELISAPLRTHAEQHDCLRKSGS